MDIPNSTPCRKYLQGRAARLAATLLLSLFVTFPALGVEVFFASPKGADKHAQKITERLRTQTEGLLQSPIERISSKTAASLSGNSNLIVANGPEALTDILKGEGNAPVVAIFITKASFESLLADIDIKTSRPFTAIYSDPDPIKQLALTKVLYGISKASVIDSNYSATYIKDFLFAAKRFGLDLSIVQLNEIESDSDFIRTTKNASSLLLIKDPELFTRVPLDRIILSSYDTNGQGIIGYSSGLVKKSGASGTTYSTLKNIAESITSNANALENTGNLKPPGFTKTFEISLNKYILRSLNAATIDVALAKRKVLKLVQEVSE